MVVLIDTRTGAPGGVFGEPRRCFARARSGVTLRRGGLFLGDGAVALVEAFDALRGMAGVLCCLVRFPMLYGTLHRGCARSGSESSGGWRSEAHRASGTGTINHLYADRKN